MRKTVIIEGSRRVLSLVHHATMCYRRDMTGGGRGVLVPQDRANRALGTGEQ